MLTLILFAALGVAGLIGALVTVARDGYRQTPTRHP